MRRRIFVSLAVAGLMTIGAVAYGQELLGHVFSDVPDTHTHAADIEWAADNGLVFGYGDGTFGPEDPVTRAQVTSMIRRYEENLSGSGSTQDDTEGPQGPQGPEGPQGPPGADGTDGVDGADGVFDLRHAALDGPTPVAIGGLINDNNTDLDVNLELEAGTYLIEVSGAFMYPDGAAPHDSTAVDVWPQLSLWLDLDGNGEFTWQTGEGSISPNALMPGLVERHIWVSGSTVIELDADTDVRLLGFGYTSTQGSEGTGEIQAISAELIATPIIP